MPAREEPRYWDLFLIILVLLGGIGAGEAYLYRALKDRKAAASVPTPAPEPVPVTPPPVPEPVAVIPPVETAPAPVAEPTPPPEPEKPKPKPKPYALKVRSRTPSGSGVAYVVQGTDRGRMQQEAALDAFISCFPEAAPDRPLEKASKKALSQWADLASQYITAAKTETDEQGMVVTFQADLGKLRKTLQARGYASSPVVPSFKVNTNGSYAPDDVVISSVGESLKSASSFFVGTAAYATPEGLEREIGKLKVSIDGEPYSVKVASKKDFGSSPVGQSIMYFVDVLPAR